VHKQAVLKTLPISLTSSKNSRNEKCDAGSVARGLPKNCVQYLKSLSVRLEENNSFFSIEIDLERQPFAAVI